MSEALDDEQQGGAKSCCWNVVASSQVRRRWCRCPAKSGGFQWAVRWVGAQARSRCHCLVLASFVLQVIAPASESWPAAHRSLCRHRRHSPLLFPESASVSILTFAAPDFGLGHTVAGATCNQGGKSLYIRLCSLLVICTIVVCLYRITKMLCASRVTLYSRSSLS